MIAQGFAAAKILSETDRATSEFFPSSRFPTRKISTINVSWTRDQRDPRHDEHDAAHDKRSRGTRAAALLRPDRGAIHPGRADERGGRKRRHADRVILDAADQHLDSRLADDVVVLVHAGDFRAVG